MRPVVIALLSYVVIGVATVSWAQEPTLENSPPVVVKTVPTAGTANVEPDTTEIKVTFSKDMRKGSMSWSTVSKDSFPTTAGDAKYSKDKRTCVLPVKLEPGKTYAIWLNSGKFGNFRDTAGHSAVPYLLVFETRKTRM